MYKGLFQFCYMETLLINRLQNKISVLECIYVYSIDLQMSTAIDDMSILQSNS